MSDIPPGPGYWRASDGNWYPPEAHPDAPSEVERAGGGTVAAGFSNPDRAGYPARLDIDVPDRVANWRALVHWIMVIPHYIIAGVLSYAAGVVALISWFYIVITGKFPAGLHGFQSMVIRYNNRYYGFALLLAEDYPPFDFETSPDDRTGYSIQSSFVHEAEHRSRLTVGFRFILIIPLALFGVVLAIAAVFAYIGQWFAVLFTGRPAAANFLCGVGRYFNRVSAYGYLLTDEYPPFNLD